MIRETFFLFSSIQREKMFLFAGIQLASAARIKILLSLIAINHPTCAGLIEIARNELFTGNIHTIQALDGTERA
jgi:hypothetical protein